MSRFSKALLVRGLSLLICVAIGGCAPAVRLDLTGGWSGQLLWVDGPSAGFANAFYLDLTHENRDISGTVQLPSHAGQSFTIPITSGSAQGHSLHIAAAGMNDRLAEPVPVSIVFEGDFDDTTMAGTGHQTVNGKTYNFTWDAQRVSRPTPPED